MLKIDVLRSTGAHIADTQSALAIHTNITKHTDGSIGNMVTTTDNNGHTAIPKRFCSTSNASMYWFTIVIAVYMKQTQRHTSNKLHEQSGFQSETYSGRGRVDWLSNI